MKSPRPFSAGNFMKFSVNFEKAHNFNQLKQISEAKFQAKVHKIFDEVLSIKLLVTLQHIFPSLTLQALQSEMGARDVCT